MHTFGKKNEYFIMLKRSDTSVLEIIFINCMKKTDVFTFSECSFLPESQDSETCLTIDLIHY